jgi:biotin-(acetyl-CoA carboxylase) ligase
VIVTRKGLGRSGRVWLTFLGALKTTVVMSDEQAGNLAELLHAARGSR